MKRWMAGLMVCGALLLGACSDDEDADDTGGDTTEAADAQDAAPDDTLTPADEDALLEATKNGNPDEVYATCVANEVIAAVDDGDLTAEEVRAWSSGEAPAGPVQDYISTPDVVTSCSAVAATTTP